MNLQKSPINRSVSCYFCSELFAEPLLPAHLDQCSQVLEPCPYKCGVYVPRRARKKHAEECATKRRYHRLSSGNTLDYFTRTNLTSSSTLPLQKSRNNSNSSSTYVTETNSNLYGLTNESIRTNNIQSISNVEIQQKTYQNTLSEILRLQKLYTDIFERYKELIQNVNTLKISQNNLNQANETEKTKTRLELEKIHMKCERNKNWIVQIDKNIEQITKIFNENSNKQTNFYQMLNDYEDKLIEFDRINTELTTLNQTFHQDRKFHEVNFASLKEDFLGFKEYLAKENIMISGVWNEQLDELRKFKNYLNDIDQELKDLSLKQYTDRFEMKSNIQLTQENNEKIIGIEQEMNTLKNSCFQLKQNLEDLVGSMQKDNSSFIASTNGHLIWRISDYSKKLKDAKEYNSAILSPIFLSSPFGYKLRMEAYLNGIGKWKNRHLIMAIQILKGEYDPILEWPCNLPVTIILRDQNNSTGDLIELVKYLTAKKKLDDKDDIAENSCQHLFIPHKTINETRYLKDDNLFFEIKVNEQKLFKK